MWTIRATQVDALGVAVRRAFEEDMRRHLEQFSPRLARTAGRDGLTRMIREGITRARAHGLTKRGPVRSFLELRIWLGAEFDADPLLPWSGSILRDVDVPDQIDRSTRLLEHARGYLGRVWGDEGQHGIAAIRRLEEFRFESLPDPEGPDFPTAALDALNVIYPDKCREVGPASIREVVRRGLERARSVQRPATPLGAGLLTALAFALGHGCERDPLYPWIAGALHDPKVEDAARRLERLQARTRTYLAQALEYYEQEAAARV